MCAVPLLVLLLPALATGIGSVKRTTEERARLQRMGTKDTRFYNWPLAGVLKS